MTGDGSAAYVSGPKSPICTLLKDQVDFLASSVGLERTTSSSVCSNRGTVAGSEIYGSAKPDEAEESEMSLLIP